MSKNHGRLTDWFERFWLLQVLRKLFTRAILANNFFLYEKWIHKNNSLCQCNDFISSYRILNSYLDDPLAEWIIWIIIHWKNETIRFFCFTSLTLHATSFCIVHKRLTSVHKVALFLLQSTPESITIVLPIQWNYEKFRRCHFILISFMSCGGNGVLIYWGTLLFTSKR